MILNPYSFTLAWTCLHDEYDIMLIIFNLNNVDVIGRGEVFVILRNLLFHNHLI
jgi:hypothetical protein